jgi:hypothetical protein
MASSKLTGHHIKVIHTRFKPADKGLVDKNGTAFPSRDTANLCELKRSDGLESKGDDVYGTTTSIAEDKWLALAVLAGQFAQKGTYRNEFRIMLLVQHVLHRVQSTRFWFGH